MYFNTHIRRKDNGLQVIVQYKHEGDKWKQKSKQGFENNKKGKQAAKDWAEETIKKLREDISLNANEDLSSITFKEFCDMHMKHLQLHLEFKTLENYKYAIMHFEPLHNLVMSTITPLHVQNCVDSLIRKGLADYTIKKLLDRIKALFNSSVNKYRIIKSSPVNGVVIRGSKAPVEKTAYSIKELHEMIDKITVPDYRLIAILGGFCGFRLGEIMGLTWSDIDFENNTININKQWKVDKFTNKYGFGELKTKNSYRINPMSTFVRKELLAYKENNKVLNITGRVFNRDTKNVSSNMLRHLKVKGYNITIHELRHSFCTNLISRGLDFKTTASLMGDTVQEIMKTYSHVTVDMREQAINILNSF